MNLLKLVKDLEKTEFFKDIEIPNFDVVEIEKEESIVETPVIEPIAKATIETETTVEDKEEPIVAEVNPNKFIKPKSKLSLFNTGFKMLVNYELFRRGISKSFNPKSKDGIPEGMQGIIDSKKRMCCEDIHFLALLELELTTGVSIDDNLDTLKLFKLDWLLVKSSFSWLMEHDLGNVITRPVFTIEEPKISGTGGFIAKGRLFKILCTDRILPTLDEMKELVIYDLVNNKYDLHDYSSFGYVNPLRKQFLIFNIEYDRPKMNVRMDNLVKWLNK